MTENEMLSPKRLEAIRKLGVVENKLVEEWKNKVSVKVDEALAKRGEYSLLILHYVPNNTTSTIWISDNDFAGRSINVYNFHVWNYLVNNKYLSKVKTVTFSDKENKHSEVDTLKFDDEFYKELDAIYENEEYVALKKEAYGQ